MSETETENQPATGSKWLGWIAVLLGLWVIVTPFILGGNNSWLLWSNIVSGLLIAILAGFVATR